MPIVLPKLSACQSIRARAAKKLKRSLSVDAVAGSIAYQKEEGNIDYDTQELQGTLTSYDYTDSNTNLQANKTDSDVSCEQEFTVC